MVTSNHSFKFPNKKIQGTDWDRIQDPPFCRFQETHFNNKDRHQLKVKRWKKIFQTNRPQKQKSVSILISDKIDFKPKRIKRDQEGHYTLTKGKIYPEYCKVHVDPHTLIEGDSNA